jgi:hypothetical protein
LNFTQPKAFLDNFEGVEEQEALSLNQYDFVLKRFSIIIR